MAKKPFMAGYKTYDDSGGVGSPGEWKEAFKVRMRLDEAVAVLGDDDPLEVLGLSGSPTFLEIKKAYRRMAMKYHPDRNDGGDETTFKKAQAAYIKLGT